MGILQKICCFFLLTKLFLYLCPDEKYEAYLALLLEWTLFFMIITSIFGSNYLSDSLQRGQKVWEEIQKQMHSGEVLGEQETIEEIIRQTLDEEVLREMQQNEGFEKTQHYGQETP